MKKLIFLLLCFSGLWHGAHALTECCENCSVTLYYSPNCPYSREVLAYLNRIQKKIPMKNVREDPDAKEELKRIGGILEVPCLVAGDVALYGSETIIEWLKTHKEELEKASSF